MNDLNIQQEPIFSDKKSQEELAQQRAQALKNMALESKKALPLQRELSPPKPFPFDTLGSVLGSLARRIHEIVKAPDSICGNSVLGAAGLLTQPYADIHIDGRIHPLSLFLMTVAESGDRVSYQIRSV